MVGSDDRRLITLLEFENSWETFDRVTRELIRRYITFFNAFKNSTYLSPEYEESLQHINTLEAKCIIKKVAPSFIYTLNIALLKPEYNSKYLEAMKDIGSK